jgi:hypothetical protein
MKTIKTEPSMNETSTGFPVLFTKDEFKKSIVEAVFALANQTYFTFMKPSGSSFSNFGEQIWALLSDKPYGGSTFANPGTTPEHIDLTFSDIERLSIVETLIVLYDYGVHGILETSGGRIDYYDGYENQVARIFYDLDRSTFLQEWGNYGAYSNAVAVERCLYVCELANARLMLEGSDEGFFLEDREEGFLSIRQMALLSGMTEASIRTLASRSRKSQLDATSDSNSQLVTTNDGKNTSIDINDAKAWLKAKGRYVPITAKRTKGEVDFTSRKFTSIDDIEDAISDRLEFLGGQHGEEEMNARTTKAGVVWVIKEIVPGVPLSRAHIGEEQLLNNDLMRRLADVLELPSEMFALRAAEAVMQERLRAIEKQLKQMQQTK